MFSATTEGRGRPMIPARAARRTLTALVVGGVLVAAAMASGCDTTEAPKSRPLIVAGEHHPAVWGERYPEVYAQWLGTRDRRPAGASVYKRGYDGGVMFDKLSEYPFMPLLFKGWGFGIEYNEPRGHYYMLIDQQAIDPSRVKAGGVCLTCKSPYAQDLYEADKTKLFSASYSEAVGMLPKQHRQLGVACIDCHNTATLKLQTRRWTVDAGLKDLGLSQKKLSRTAARVIVCGQCHCTYSVMKDDQGKSVDIDYPWEGATWGAISVEQIIANIEMQKPRHEWTQKVTGMKLGFIRHPEFEFYTAGSDHFNAGVGCSDCHMDPTSTPDGGEVADHNVISPLKQDMDACGQCHTATPAEMRARVIAIQKASLADLIDTGYKVASVAKLFEFANNSLETTSGDAAYDSAAAHYRQAFYRLVYMGAENSVGFHNPDESTRILADARREAAAADAGIRKLLVSKRLKAPVQPDLELARYLADRGERHLGFRRVQYIADPTGSAERQVPSLRRLLE